MIEYNKSIENFVNEIGFKTDNIVGILKKPNGRKLIKLSWEKYDNSNDKWFLECTETYLNKNEKCLIILPDAVSYIKYLLKLHDYKMYIHKI